MGMFRTQHNLINNFYIKSLVERIEKLEEKVFKNARKDTTTVRQQILLLHHLGLLEKLDELKLTRDKKAKLLSVLLNGSFDNIRGWLSEVHKTKNSELRSENNYAFLQNIFAEIGLKKQEGEAEKILDEIRKLQEQAK